VCWGYGQSNTANILFAVELDSRGQPDGVRAFSLHPGGIPGTGLEKHVPVADVIAAGVMDKEGIPRIDPAKDVKSIPIGAATQTWCATSPQLNGVAGATTAWRPTPSITKRPSAFGSAASR
jgi:NAD(P)-dependent dehydrogenase (short-subunit alcohol dehydrogenase family)